MKLAKLTFFFSLIIAICNLSWSTAQVNQTDAQGKKHGEWVVFYEGSSVPRYKGQFEHGKPVGKFVHYYPSSVVKMIILNEDNSDRAAAYFYHENKTLLAFGIYKDQKKDSVWTHYRPTGDLSFKETYKNDELNGLRTTYYGPEATPGEQVVILRKCMYKDGRANGEVTEYFADGILKLSGKYKQGVFDGQVKRYHPNGKIMILERWKGRQKHGWWITYDLEGREVGRAYFRHGKRLEGAQLDNYMQELKENGINPNE
jgi:antitoxin component YwqK of YwqJK toxin-antitoxin module